MSDRNIEKVIDIAENVQPADVCNICFENLVENAENPRETPVVVRECAHSFHVECIRRWLAEKSTCPVCRKSLFTITGFQPRSPLSTFEVTENPHEHITGYAECGTLTLTFHIEPGIQGSDMPLPNERHFGLNMTCFLPNNSEGQELVRLLRIAWTRGLLFRIGFNPNSHRMDWVVPNGIEFKLRKDSGMLAQGYPDPSYMNRLKCDLKDVGVL